MTDEKTKIELRKVIVDYIGETDHATEPHSWRCNNPDRFPGYCTCTDEMLAQIVRVVDAAEAEEGAVAPMGEAEEAAMRRHMDEYVQRNTEVAKIIAEMIDPAPCEWDHNHSCQAHGYYYIPQGQKCPNQAAKDWLEH